MGFIRGAAVVLAASTMAFALSGCGVTRSVFGGGDREAAAASPVGIGVNGHLWRASLDTLAFLPLLTADPWGGVINYDWYSDPAAPNERFKATVFILDSRLRADALNVTINRQVRNEAGEWADTRVSAQTETDLENAILTRARQLRLAAVAD